MEVAMSIYDYSYTAIGGGEVKMSEYSGKVLLIVNTASKCGFTPQYEGLEQLHKTYSGRGLVVIGFPCNQFGKQEPADEGQISEFCKVRFGVTFPLSAKIDVNGENALPLYTFLEGQKPFESFGKGTKAVMMKGVTKAKPGDKRIMWNFTKFLVDREGNVFGRYEPTVEPQAVAADIEKLLGGAK
jgi:glutathione peroxidase